MKKLLSTVAVLAIIAGPALGHERQHRGFPAPPYFPPNNTTITINPPAVVVFFPAAHRSAPVQSYSAASSETVYYDPAQEAAKPAARAAFCAKFQCAKEYPLGVKIPGEE